MFTKASLCLPARADWPTGYSGIGKQFSLGIRKDKVSSTLLNIWYLCHIQPIIHFIYFVKSETPLSLVLESSSLGYKVDTT